MNPPLPPALPPALARSLAGVGTLMVAARDPWWIIASAAVALHGADPGRVADVDVLLSVRDARHILPSIGVEPRPGTAHTQFRSDIFASWPQMPLPVEFMAGFHHHADGRWSPVRPASRERVDSDGVSLFIPDRAELCDMLLRFGRPKDMERARRLMLSAPPPP